MSEYTPQEKRFLKRLGFTPGPWESTEASNFSGTLVCLVKFGGKIVFQSRHDDSEYTKEQCANDGRLAAQSPDMFLTLFHVSHTEQHFCQEADEVARFESMIAPLESATNKTWPDLCRIWNECK